MTLTGHVALGDIATFVRGITFKPGDVVPVGSAGAAACMRSKNVQAELDLSDVWGIPESFVKREEQYLVPGDVLVSSANSWNLVGRCCWVPKLPWRSTFGGFVSVLRAHPTKVDARYLFHWFASDRTQATVRSFGQQTTNISNLNVSRCLGLKLRLPPLSKQRQIAAILDNADSLRAKRRAAIGQLDALAQSIFLDMFGDPISNPNRWPCWSLQALANVTTGRTPPSGMKGTFDGSIPFMTPGDLESHEPVMRYVTEAGAQASAVAAPGATLVCCIGATIGKMGKALVRSAFNQQINAIAWGDRVDADYGLAVMRFFKPTIVAWGTSTTLPILKKSLFERIEIPVPDLRSQREFSDRVRVIAKLRAWHGRTLIELETLFGSLQHRAFRGEF
ncbi:MAG: restriction endonuclease subunit S [Coriobacteriia bacterium]